MKRFEFIEHTADIGLIAYGSDLAEAYANAAYGMFSIVTDPAKVKEIESRVVEVVGTDPESLLFEWLNQLIYIFDTQMLLFKRCDITELGERRLKAVCHGEKYDRLRHELKLGIKSATYHMLKVDKEKNQVRVIFDV